MSNQDKLARSVPWHSMATKRRAYFMAYDGEVYPQDGLDHCRDVACIISSHCIFRSDLPIDLRLRLLASQGMSVDEYAVTFLGYPK